MSRLFFRNAAFLTMVEIILKLKGFIFIPLLTRYFGTINYGVWSQVGIVVSTVTPLLILGTDSAILRYLPGRPLLEQRRYFSAWMVFLIGSALLCSTLFVFLQRPLAVLFFGESGEYTKYMPLAAFSLLSTFALTTLRNWYRIQNSAKIYGFISLAQAVFGLATLLIVLVRHLGVYQLVLLNIIADLLVAVWLFGYMMIHYGIQKPDFTILSCLIKFGLPLVPAGYAMWGLNTLGRLFLVKYSTLADLGIYSLCFTLGYMIIQVFVNPIWNLFPNTAAELYNQRKQNELQQLFNKSVGIIIAIALPSIVGLFIMGDRILGLLATPDFSRGASVMAIITLGYLFHMLSSYFDVALGLVHRQYFSTLSIITGALCTLALNFILIPRLSILGAAIASAIGFSVQFTMSYCIAMVYTELRVDIRFPGKIVAYSVLMGLLVWVAARYIAVPRVAGLMLPVIVGFLAYVSLLYVSGVLTPSMMRTAWGGIRGRLFKGA